MKLQISNLHGNVVNSVQVRDDVFGVPASLPLIHQVMVGQLANARQGTANAKTRAQVSGGGRKPRPQKHTGAARAGTIRSPIWRGGGVAFGPHPRNFRHHTPKKMRRLSLIMTLSEKARKNELIVLETLALDPPTTKGMVQMLNALDTGQSTLLVADGAEASVLHSARNIPGLKMMPASLLNTLDLLNCHKVVMTVDAVRKTEELWGKSVRAAQKQSVGTA